MNEEVKKKQEELKGEIYEDLKKYLTWDDYIKLTQWLNEHEFWLAPASTKYHGAHPCGLAEHSIAVAKNLVSLTEKLGLKWANPRSPFIIGLLHDLCKTDQYKLDNTYMIDLVTTGYHYSYRTDSIFSHHGEKSICMLTSIITLTEEEVACIRWHMGAYETDTNEWKYYGNAIAKYPNVLWTHTADMMASHIDGV